MPVAAKDHHKTAFATPFGLFQFRVMPFGLNGAPESFQQMMDRVVNDHRTLQQPTLMISSSTVTHGRMI